ncbi:hypothetical protein B0H17DRAFT_1083540 [Mycena rosella]|uniref:Enoyl reductase (ER) domain-containing protein n=1 Tax=Mycena rosella TaxID=1033263 RepID=A0AAD7D4A7_MYCRO|nr:hypothetical protein B0H17DRAFT_1083540 [Mycena rosella]
MAPPSRPVPNPRIVFTKRPGNGFPVVGEHISLDNTRSIDLERVLLNGGFLTKTLLLSPEPAMRERMRDPEIRSYTTTAIVGAPLVGFGLVVVLRSEKDGIKAGDHMFGMTPFEAYTLQPYIEGRVEYKESEWPAGTFDMDSLALQVVPDPQGAFPWSRYCSILGIPGLSAFAGFEAYANAQEGETIFVSSGASGVGSMVIQLAKMKGMKVIASAGTNKKVEHMKRLGADVAFNYNMSAVSDFLREHGPLDLFWDNVGGSTLEAAIEHLTVYGRIIMCGSASEYNIGLEDRHGIKNTSYIFKKRLTVQGFLIADHAAKMAPRFFSEVPALVAQGKLVSEEHLVHGIENGPAAFVDMLKGGRALGKPVIVVAEE